MIKILLFYLGLSKRLRITEKLQNLYRWRRPIKPYAFIRACNEIKTIDLCLKSVLPALEGGVIGFNSCTDGTKEYILEFCKKYPQFIPVEYPFDVIPSGDSRYMHSDLELNTRLDSYYNFVWDKLPKNKWVVKIDCDHYFNLEAFQSVCKLPIRRKDCVILNRINLHYFNNVLYINKKNPVSESSDSWIIYNNRNIRFEFWRGWVDNRFTAYEYLPLPSKERKKIFAICTNWHFPNIKNQRNEFNLEEWIEFSKFDFENYFKNNRLKGRIQQYMINEKNIINAFNQFNHSGKRIFP